jgi:hypothetical protein
MTFMKTTRAALALAALTCIPALTLRADFSYEQSSKITGGMMASMMKVAGVFSKSAREPIRTTVVVKGDRMATLTTDSASIIDLSKETITEVNFKQKQFSVITFAEMARYLELMAQKTAKETGGKADVQFKASVKETGKTQTLSGLGTREVILTLIMESQDKESGQKGSMNVTADMWLAKDVPGYGEVRAFQQKMAQKLAWMPGSNAFAQGRGDLAKGFGDLQKEAAKLDGVPVLQTIAMGGAGAPGQPGQPAAGQTSQPKQESEPASITGSLGKRLGGLGGFGRKKKEEPKQEEAQQQPAAASSAPSGGSASLMEMTTELTNFSAASVDGSKLEVPAGFKKVENEMQKALR